jgi:hypothetical protein
MSTWMLDPALFRRLSVMELNPYSCDTLGSSEGL